MKEQYNERITYLHKKADSGMAQSEEHIAQLSLFFSLTNWEMLVSESGPKHVYHLIMKTARPYHTTQDKSISCISFYHMATFRLTIWHTVLFSCQGA